MQTGTPNGKQKKIPERRCVGCGERREKRELLRVVRSPEGDISLDFTGKKSGRGAYLCHSAACLRRAQKQHRLDANLGVTVPDEVYEALEKELVGNGG